MSTLVNVPARLEELLGRDRVCSSEREIQEFAVAGRTPTAVLKPQSATEVAEAVRFAAAQKLAVICCGSRSKLEIGMPPRRYDVALDLTGLREIAHYDAGDLTLSVDAGLPLHELKKVLAAKNQFLPLALPFGESSTIGGAVASGIDSALRQQYGTVRDFLIGAEFVDGQGLLCKSGGRVVKNVTGYDLHKLLIGSLGTLAAITRLNFRTFPLPELRRGHLAGFSSLETAMAFRAALLHSGLPLSNLEGFDQGLSNRLPKPAPAHAWNVYVAFEGNETVVRRIERELHRLAAETKAKSSEALDTTVNQHLNDALQESFDWLSRLTPSLALLRIVLPSFSSAEIMELTEHAAQPKTSKTLLLRSCNVGYLVLTEESEDTASRERLGSTTQEMLSRVERKRGSATLLHAPLWLKGKVNMWGPARPDFALMQRVKHAFDPQNVFAPGRFVGGL